MPITTVDKITALLEQENPDAPFFVYHDAIKRIRDEVANMNPNGGSSPLRVRYPFAFDTPALATVGFPITAVDQGANTFTVAGDHRAIFDALFASGAGTFAVDGSTGNDGFFNLVAPSVFAAGQTTVAIVSVIPDATADGTIYALAGGVPLYTPSDGDTLILAAVHVDAAFNGGTPTLRVFQANTDPTFDDLAFDLSTADLVPDGSTSPTAWRQLQAGNIQGEAAGDVLVMSAGGALTALLCDTATLTPPGSSAGSGVLSLVILPAA